MELRELGAADLVPSPSDLTTEQRAAALALYDAQFDSVAAEKEYRAMTENGGMTWEQLMEKLTEIDRKNQARSA